MNGTKILKVLMILVVTGAVFWASIAGVQILIGSFNWHMPEDAANVIIFGSGAVIAVIAGYMAYSMLLR